MTHINNYKAFESKKDINCDCGWSWDLNDSEDFDKFICHKCGNDLESKYSSLLEKNIAKDKELWNQCVQWAKNTYDVWPSAYAAGAAAKRYKSKGGKWKKSNENIESFIEFNESHGGLDKWFKEKWVDISKTNPDGSHPPCGREDASKGGYPKCRKVRVAARMSDKDKKNSVQRKRRAEKEGDKSKKRTPNYSK